MSESTNGGKPPRGGKRGPNAELSNTIEGMERYLSRREREKARNLKKGKNLKMSKTGSSTSRYGKLKKGGQNYRGGERRDAVRGFLQNGRERN